MSMNDDELIRDAVHELVAAAPPPKPLPAGMVLCKWIMIGGN